MLRSSINLIQLCSANQLRQNVRSLFISATNEAARKGTREKANKKKVKVEIKKVGFVPHNHRKKLKIDTSNKHIDDSWQKIPLDDVYVGKYYRWRVYTFSEAVEYHRETHHPTMYNEPNAKLIAHIELNMKGEKGTRMVENFHRMAHVKHKFDHGEERTILVLTKGEDLVEASRKAGATLVGGPELVKGIQNGDILLSDYQYIIAHPNILPDLVPVRGLMKRKFPGPKQGTLGIDLEDMIQRFLNGIQYSAMKDEHQNDYGLVNTVIGTLNMNTKHLEENFEALLKDIDTLRPKRAGQFITRVLLKSPPSGEVFKIDPFIYVPQGKKEVVVEDKKGKKAAKKQVKEEISDESEAVAVN